MGEYDKARATALRLITKKANNKVCYVVRMNRGVSPDPSKPWRVGNPDYTSYPCVAVMFSYEVDRIERDQVLKTDRKVLIPASGLQGGSPLADIEPKVGMFFVDAQERWWSIENNPLVAPDTQTNVLWELQVREWPSRSVLR